jgi:hypothetical protein
MFKTHSSKQSIVNPNICHGAGKYSTQLLSFNKIRKGGTLTITNVCALVCANLCKSK